METFDEDKLQKSLSELAVWKRLAFMTAVGERMLPNYCRFSAETGFGDVTVLRKGLDAAWTWIESGNPPDDLGALRQACDRQAPDTERFESIYTSAALDAANAAAIVLDAVESPDEARAVDVAALARDTIDLFVQELMDLDPNAPDFDGEIVRHHLMQSELLRQREDLEALANWSKDRQSLGRELRDTSVCAWGSLGA